MKSTSYQFILWDNFIEKLNIISVIQISNFSMNSIYIYNQIYDLDNLCIFRPGWFTFMEGCGWEIRWELGTYILAIDPILFAYNNFLELLFGFNGNIKRSMIQIQNYMIKYIFYILCITLKMIQYNDYSYCTHPSWDLSV